MEDAPTLACELDVVHDYLSPVGAAQLGRHCLVAANRRGIINVPEIDAVPLCVGTCGLAELERPAA